MIDSMTQSPCILVLTKIQGPESECREYLTQGKIQNGEYSKSISPYLPNVEGKNMGIIGMRIL